MTAVFEGRPAVVPRSDANKRIGQRAPAMVPPPRATAAAIYVGLGTSVCRSRIPRTSAPRPMSSSWSPVRSSRRQRIRPRGSSISAHRLTVRARPARGTRRARTVSRQHDARVADRGAAETAADSIHRVIDCPSRRTDARARSLGLVGQDRQLELQHGWSTRFDTEMASSEI